MMIKKEDLIANLIDIIEGNDSKTFFINSFKFELIKNFTNIKHVKRI